LRVVGSFVGLRLRRVVPTGAGPSIFEAVADRAD